MAVFDGVVRSLHLLEPALVLPKLCNWSPRL
jgi:hypothetical protein